MKSQVELRYSSHIAIYWTILYGVYDRNRISKITVKGNTICNEHDVYITKCGKPKSFIYIPAWSSHSVSIVSNTPE